MRRFELVRTDATQIAVPSFWIVEVFDVFSHVEQCTFPIRVDAFLDAFFLQAAEERFCDRIVPAVSSPTHARLQAVGFAEAPPCVASILRSLIGVNERLTGSPTS